jgi:hypothetical protein
LECSSDDANCASTSEYGPPQTLGEQKSTAYLSLLAELASATLGQNFSKRICRIFLGFRIRRRRFGRDKSDVIGEMAT